MLRIEHHLLGLIIFTFLFMPTVMMAHETHVYEIGGEPYIFIVGSLNEPITVDDRTGVDLRVLRSDPTDPTNRGADAVEPVTGLESTLEVELQAGEKRLLLPLAPAWRDPGAYRAVFYPTVATTYTYRFIGEINGVEVDLRFVCNPVGHVGGEPNTERVEISDDVLRIYAASDFGCPTTRAGIMFPEQTLSSLETADHLLELERQVAQTRWMVVGVLFVVFLLFLYRRRNITTPNSYRV